jgi:uncharacterized membrane-anchored protein YitT (DUF2179 family)
MIIGGLYLNAENNIAVFSMFNVFLNVILIIWIWKAIKQEESPIKIIPSGCTV